MGYDQWERTRKHWVTYHEIDDTTSLVPRKDTHAAMNDDAIQARLDEVSELLWKGKDMCLDHSTLFQLACKEAWPTGNVYSGKQQVRLTVEHELKLKKEKKKIVHARSAREEKSKGKDRKERDSRKSDRPRFDRDRPG
jgi:hypothetical protein